MRLAVPAVVVWVTTAALLQVSVVAAVLVAIVAAAATIGALISVRLRPSFSIRLRPAAGPALRTIAAVMACTAGAAVMVAFRLDAVASGPVAEAASAGQIATVEAVLTRAPRPRLPKKGLARREGIVAEARIERIDRRRVRADVVVLATGPGWQGMLPSQRVRMTARLVPGDPADLISALALVRGRPEVIGDPSMIQAAAARIRRGLRDASDHLPPRERGLLPGLVVGDTSRLDEQLKEDFRRSGLSHLNAVSGANLAIVGGAVLAVAAAVGLPLIARAIVIALAMVAFAVVAQLEPSVLRALMMGLVGALALGTGRSRQGLAALAFAVLILVVASPSLATDWAFVLSAVATAGLLLIAPRWRDRLRRFLPPLVADAVAVAAAAQVAVTPFLIALVGEVSLIAVPANIAAAPAVPIATLLGFGAALLSQLHLGAAELLTWAAGYPCRWIVTVAEAASALPAAAISVSPAPGPYGLPGVVLVVCTAGVIVLAIYSRRWRYVVAAVVAGFAGILIVLPAGWPPEGWVMVACDIGQGDMLALNAGDRRAVVIDSGPAPPEADRCLRDLGIHTIPVLVLSHYHADHVGGVSGVRHRRAIGMVLASNLAEPEGEARRTASALSGLPRHVARTGQGWRFPNMVLSVLGPDEHPPAGGSASNNASVVLHVRWRQGSALLTGDVENEAQEAISPPPAEILKIPHHGSDRQDDRFIEGVRAKVALVSVGEGNTYGHPAPRLMRRLAELRMRVYRTDLHGDIAVVGGPGGLSIVVRGGL